MKQVDKGFAFFYHSLSSRRKFIRTLWATILGVLLSAYGLLTLKDKGRLLVFVLIFAIAAVWQLIETYRKYKAGA